MHLSRPLTQNVKCSTLQNTAAEVNPNPNPNPIPSSNPNLHLYSTCHISPETVNYLTDINLLQLLYDITISTVSLNKH